MKAWKVLAILYYVLALAVTLIPRYWWFVQAGGIMTIQDSPYMLDVNFLNERLLLLNLLNAVLTGFRFYMMVMLSYGIYAVLRNKEFIHSTFFVVTVFYILEPLLFYLITQVLQLLNVTHPEYSPIFIGTTTMTVTAQNAVAVMTVSFYPLKLYWFALASAVFYPFAKLSLYLERRGRARH